MITPYQKKVASPKVPLSIRMTAEADKIIRARKKAQGPGWTKTDVIEEALRIAFPSILDNTPTN